LVAGELPTLLAGAGDEGGTWWTFESLAAAAEADVGAASRIADTLGALEQELETALADALPSLRGDDTGAQATEFMGGIATRVDTSARALLATLDARHG
ncbi:MAG: hypothetical protein ACKOCT_06875, partial [Alphaproteobacteria bacterium]